jgi:hypothetical protein
MYVPYTYACHLVHRNDNHQCSFFSLSHHVAELNLIVVIKKTSEGEMILFIHSFFSSLSFSLTLNVQNEREGETEREREKGCA